MLLLGAHFSIAEGFHNALLTAEKLKCNCVQLFVKNQRQWHARDLAPEAMEKWWEVRNRLRDRITHIIAHSGYLINLASDREAVRRLSSQALEDELRRCELLGIDRLVMHPGSHRGQGAAKGIKLVSNALNQILPYAPKVTLLLEGTAGAGDCLGATIEELAQLLDSSRVPYQLGCCLDTCHLFAAGYDLSPENAFDSLFEAVDRHIGLERLQCLHLNDSAGARGSHLDRHEHIGKGRIGLDSFRYLLNHARLAAVPKIIETPKGRLSHLTLDKQNLNVLRQMARQKKL